MGARRLRFRCPDCGKPLTDAFSTQIGVGPTCRMNRKLREYGDMSIDLFNHAHAAHYDFSVEDGIVCVVDHRSGRSVTNDARNVVASILLNLGDRFPGVVIYRDLQNVWDQLVVRHGRFAGFRALGTFDKEEAKLLVVKRMKAGAPVLTD